MDSGRLPVNGEARVCSAGMTRGEECGVHDLETRHCIIPAALAVLRTPDAASPLRRHSGGHTSTQAKDGQSAGIHGHVHFARVDLRKAAISKGSSRHRQSQWIPADRP